MDWGSHKYRHKLCYYWLGREELTEIERKKLNTKMVLNYWGYYGNVILHLSLGYCLYKKGFFNAQKEWEYWTKLAGTFFFGSFSIYKIDKLIKQDLSIFVADLLYRYRAEIDLLRREKQENLSELKINKMIEFKKLEDKGIDVKRLEQLSESR
ncbi:unnamed protein product [Blepharisma stoltei]|uniref:Uncharacterized protein n=1 Tax=Blepharisma stoltei TaxID=1481888 RepID=A0AAU9IG74_9CILI|nr:unnamed protein product [Blepharisma stoltei]